MTRQPGPRRKPGVLSWKAMTELLILLQERPAISDSAIPTGFVLKSLDMAPGMFFIQRRARFGSLQIVAYERGRVPICQLRFSQRRRERRTEKIEHLPEKP